MLQAVIALGVVAAAMGCSSSIGDSMPDLDGGAASCEDGLFNGDETDTDCGGTCAPCNIGLGCDGPADCGTGVCAVGICVSAPSCQFIAEASRDEARESGVYTLTIDDVAFDAYCDFEHDGGGWTLVMKLTSDTATFVFDSALWTNDELLAADDLAPHTDPLAATEAKLEAFGKVTGLELRLEFTDPAHSFSFSQLSNRSALELFTGDVEEAVVENSAGNNCAIQFLASTPGFDATIMRHGQGHQFFGVNGTDTGNGGAEPMRFGFGSNDENNSAWRPHQGMGTPDESLVWDGQNDCGNCGGCYGTAVEPASTTANLWVR